MHTWSTYPAVANLADGYYDGMVEALATAMAGTTAEHQQTITERIPGLLNFATGLVTAVGDWHTSSDRFCGRLLADIR